tara:strand:+ start:404 stop:1558 length:1155 start_codon:yes stop_codon:yes gene_type:complete
MIIIFAIFANIEKQIFCVRKFMKLFKSLLVAPATLGLLVPMSATANEVTINDFNSAEELVITNNHADGLEARFNDYEAGSFSSTTTASFSVDFAIGSVDGNTSSETVGTAYGYQIDLSSSFTGEDALSVSIDAGTGAAQLSELDLNSGGDSLIVDGITYSFPLGEKLTVLVGDSTDGSALYSTACVYGGFTNTLDDCGNYSSAFTTTGTSSVGFSASYDIGNGFTGAIGYAGSGTATTGLMASGTDYYGGQLTYTGESYGASVTYANLDTAIAWGLNGYYAFDSGLPSVSVGYEFTENEGATKDDTQWFAGLQWDEIGPGSLGIAAGNKGPQREGATEELAYEAFYAYSVNDSMTITPAVFILENNQAGEVDETGVVVKTSFSF